MGDAPLPAGRLVIHAVVDTNRATAAERLRLYIDGAELPVRDTNCGPGGTCAFAAEAATFPLAGQFLTLGNRGDGNRSFAGSLTYVALYNTPLTAAQIADQVAALDLTDDR